MTTRHLLFLLISPHLIFYYFIYYYGWCIVFFSADNQTGVKLETLYQVRYRDCPEDRNLLLNMTYLFMSKFLFLNLPQRLNSTTVMCCAATSDHYLLRMSSFPSSLPSCSFIILLETYCLCQLHLSMLPSTSISTFHRITLSTIVHISYSFFFQFLFQFLVLFSSFSIFLGWSQSDSTSRRFWSTQWYSKTANKQEESSWYWQG